MQVIKIIIRKNNKLQQAFDKKLMQLPVIGNLVRDAIMARFSMVLANLIAGGVNLIEATEITKNSIANTKIKASIEKVKREIFSGRPFSVALRETKDFPETMCGFIEVGEETGKLNDMLTTVSLYYEGEFDSSVEAFSSMSLGYADRGALLFAFVVKLKNSSTLLASSPDHINTATEILALLLR